MFRFAAKATQRIVIDCQAGKLDSMMDATMSLGTADISAGQTELTLLITVQNGTRPGD